MSNSKNIYIHENHKRQEIREFLLENADYTTRPETTVGSDKGLLYFDTEISRIIVWNGTEWKVVKYFDDHNLESSDNVKFQDIWADSYQVSILTESEAQTGTQSIIQYWEDRPTTHIPGSWTFYPYETGAESIVFPKTFSDENIGVYPDFYEPVVKNSVGTIINNQYYNINEYRIAGKIQYRIEFLDGKKMNQLLVNSTLLPTITFYRYVGERLSLSYIQGSVLKLQFEGNTFFTDPNNTGYMRRSLVGTDIQNVSKVYSFSANGQELSVMDHYIIYEDSGVYYISVNIGITGTNWTTDGGIHSDDLFYLNSKSSIH